MNLPEESQWLAGRAFVSWLEEGFGFEAKPHGKAVERRVSEWRKGRPVSVWRADSLLTLLGLHLSMVPDDVWLEARTAEPPPISSPYGRRYPAELRNDVIAQRLSGTSTKALERRYGIPRRRITQWLSDAKHKAAH